ncbi:hypothetical protein ZYGR_0AS04600 [Zygosaccharomyces rouxii]|uniref:D-isomer specific 2-hydroxyacid dehydrogenase NAD-binding domain-containing protein n=1 Tax=Zygosaccharomyces rouxii TaxID=4956 RepID=A0A1Q3AHB4_ZYGRO|nr:hypothetical protein ZYGR_0AS04600 [Zygosaccharomyces rouxii]
MPKPKVLIPYQHKPDVADHTPEWDQLSQKVEFIKYKITDVEEFKRYLAESSIQGFWITDELFAAVGGPSELWDYYPDTLKVMLIPWVGYDFIDGRRLRDEKGVVLCNIGPNARSSVADLAVYLTLSCFRMTSFWEHCLKHAVNGRVLESRKYLSGGSTELWQSYQGPVNDPSTRTAVKFQYPAVADANNDENLSRHFTIGNKVVDTPSGKTALILGFGNIGQSIGKRLACGFDMRVKYVKRSGPLPRELLGYDAEYCPNLEDTEVWNDVDVIILSLPGNAQTDNMINSEVLKKCKDGVRIVNVGRGSCIDEDALLEALDSGKVNSCGLDVFKDEMTQVRPDLLMRFDVTALPHIGSAVESLVIRQTVVTLQNVESVLVKGEGGVFPVN